MKITNLTPHTIVYQQADGTRVEYPSEGVARVSSTPSDFSVTSDGITIYGRDIVGKIVGLKTPDPGECLLVSAVVGAAVAEQHATELWSRRVIVPGTGPQDNPIRENGQVVAVTRFKFVVQ